MQSAISDFEKFCSYCGSTLDYISGNLFTCNNSHHIYINPKPTNGVILENEKGEILLVKRKADPGKGMWDVPGGFVDLNETLEESTARELKEELGISVTNLKYITSKIDTYPYQGIDYPTLCLYFSGNIRTDDKISISSDIDGYSFFDIKNLPYEKMAFGNLKEFFREYAKK